MAFDRQDLDKHFGRIWPVHVDRFTELLIELRRHFHGDLDRMLVLAIVGSRTLPDRRIRHRSYREFRAGDYPGTEPSPINVQSISDTSGIPRETVRRKIGALERAGWVRRLENGHLVVTDKARRDLEPATEATFAYLVEVVAACMDAMSDGPAPGP